jgi:hypothetical protein
MQTNNPEEAINFYEVAGNIRSGKRTVKALLTGREGSPDNYKLAYSYGEEESDWATPRHRHLFEQVRFPIEGDYSIGRDRVLPAGWVGYFPESAYYGPQIMSPNLKMVVLQFGGPSGLGFYSIAQRKAAMEDLKAQGEFKNGMFSWHDAEGKRHNKDAGEAVWEQMHGTLEYPPVRYSELVIMNPTSFEWVKDDKQPGVLYRRMGSFSERDIRIGLVRVEAGATLRFGVEPAAEILFLAQGSVENKGQTFQRLSAFSSEADETTEPLTAVEPAEFLYVKMPTF